jgi:hypothetical protein
MKRKDGSREVAVNKKKGARCARGSKRGNFRDKNLARSHPTSVRRLAVTPLYIVYSITHRHEGDTQTYVGCSRAWEERKRAGVGNRTVSTKGRGEANVRRHGKRHGTVSMRKVGTCEITVRDERGREKSDNSPERAEPTSGRNKRCQCGACCYGVFFVHSCPQAPHVKNFCFELLSE